MRTDTLSSSVNVLELLDTSSVQIPARSALYHLEPVGIGTAYAECFTSYLSRLAHAHHLLPGELIRKQIQIHLPSGYREEGLRGSQIYLCARVLNGLGVMAKDWVKALEFLTLRSDLSFLTMMTWKEIFPTQGLLRFKRAWCPSCYEEWRMQGQVVYEPLLWAVNEVEICVHHLRKLISACPHCGKSLPHLDRKYRPGYCSKCNGWLGSTSTVKCTDDIENVGDKFEWQAWVATNIGDLIAASPSLFPPPKASRIAEMVSAFIKKHHRGKPRAFASWLDMNARNISSWCREEKLPQLRTLIHICYRLNISIVEFLTGSNTINNHELLGGRTREWNKTAEGKKRVDRKSTKRKLESILASKIYPPPTMKKISEQFDVSYRRLYYLFPDLCRAISAKHAAYQRQCKLKNINRVCEEVAEIVLKLHIEGVEPTEGRVASSMLKGGYLRDEQVWAIFVKSREKLGYNSCNFREHHK